VSRRKIGQRLRHAIENFWRRAFQFHHAHVNLRQRFPLGHLVGQLQVGFFEGTAEAAHAIAILADVLALGSFRMWRM